MDVTRIRVQIFGTPLKDTYCTTFGGVGSGKGVSFFRNSIHNLISAVEARVFKRKIGQEWSYVDETPHAVGIYLQDETFTHALKANVRTAAPMTDDQFIQNYRGRRRRVYESARQSLRQNDLKRSDADCKCFLKKEKDIPIDKPEAIPRVITFPDPRFGMCFGKYVKSIEHKLFQAIDETFGQEVVMKGKNYETLGQIIYDKWNKFQDPCSIDCDVSRLDSCISNEAQQFYHKLTSFFFDGHDREDYKILCEMQLDVKVRGRATDGTIEYKSSGLGSGQMNTSQMGVFVVCFVLYKMFERYDLNLELINCGDDFTVIGERYEVERYSTLCQAWFQQYNLTLKMEGLNEIIEGINFCQTNPVRVNGSYRMVRNPLTALIKDSTSIDNLTNASLKAQYLHAISCTGIATHGGIPIFQESYAMYGRYAQEYRKYITSKRGLKRSMRTTLKDSSMLYWGKGLACRYQEISDETRYSFYLAFGLDIVSQKHIEKYYSTVELHTTPAHEHIGDRQLW